MTTNKGLSAVAWAKVKSTLMQQIEVQKKSNQPVMTDGTMKKLKGTESGCCTSGTHSFSYLFLWLDHSIGWSKLSYFSSLWLWSSGLSRLFERDRVFFSQSFDQERVISWSSNRDGTIFLNLLVETLNRTRIKFLSVRSSHWSFSIVWSGSNYFSRPLGQDQAINLSQSSDRNQVIFSDHSNGI